MSGLSTLETRTMRTLERLSIGAAYATIVSVMLAASVLAYFSAIGFVRWP